MSILTFALRCNIFTQSLELNVALVAVSKAICLFFKASCCFPKRANLLLCNLDRVLITWMYYVPIVK